MREVNHIPLFCGFTWGGSVMRKQEKSKKHKERMIEAKKSLKKIQKEIEPFQKQRKSKTYSTTGKWRNNLNFDY